MSVPAPRTTPFLAASRPLAMAHRGGAGYGPNVGIENTIAAFRTAVELGYGYIETDVRCSRDGVPVLVHDATLDRLAGRPGAVADLSVAELRQVRIGGREPVPTLAETLTAFADVRFNIDVKSDDAVQPTVRVVRAAGAEERVCLASFSARRLRRLRRLAGPLVTTSCSAVEVTALRLAPWRRLQAIGRRAGASSVQVPRRRRGVTVLTSGFVARAHALGLQVHVWAVEDADTIQTLLTAGVDGFIVDRIDLLRDLLEQLPADQAARDQWGIG